MSLARSNLTVAWRVPTRAAALVLGACAWLATVEAPAWAQSPPAPAEAAPGGPADLNDLSLEQLLGVEVQSVFGASKFLQRVTEAPAAVSIVTAEEIERYGWRTLADVLRTVRGFYVTDDRSWAFVGMRGFLRPGDYNTRFLLLVDGHRINDVVYDQALIQEDFSIHLSDVDRIEIVRGPSSSLYGSSAFFGIINVVTKTPAAAGGSTLASDVGTLGRREGRLTLRHEAPNGLRLGLSASLEGLTGVEALYFQEFDDARSNGGVSERLDYTRHRNLFGTLGYRGFTLRTGFNARKKGLPTAAYGTVFGDSRTWVLDERFFLDTAWERRLTREWETRIRAAYDHTSYTGNYPYDWDGDPDTAVVVYRDTGIGDWLTSEAQITGRLGRSHRLTVGLEHRQNVRQNQDGTLLHPHEPQWADRRQSSTTGLYAQDEIRVHRTLLLNLGFRQDHYSRLGNPLKPRFAAIVQPTARTTVKLLYGEAFRAPNAFESFYVTPGLYKANPSIRPEEIQTVEAIAEQYVGKRLRLSGSWFRYAVDNLITLTDDVDGLFWYANVDSARASGAEAEAEIRWPGGVHGRLSYTFTRTRDSATAMTLTNSPAHIAQALFSAPLGRDHFVGLDVRALSGRLDRFGGPLDSHVVPSVTISGPLFDPRLRFSGTIANLTGARYADPVSDEFAQTTMPQNGRTARLRLIWSF
jgi:iron complex outermembrane receptor protein